MKIKWCNECERFKKTDNFKNITDSWCKLCCRKKQEQYLRKKKRKQENARRSCKVRGAVGSHSQAQWNAVLRKYDNKCIICDSKDNLSRDHVVPISKLGCNNIENILPLCVQCNSNKGSQGVQWYIDKLKEA